MPAAGSYVTNSNVDKFEGTWKWVNGSKEIVFQLKKFKHRMAIGNYDEDIILGSHSYKINANTIESSGSDFANIPSNHKLASIFVYNNPQLGVNALAGNIDDISKKTSQKIKIEFIPNTSPAQISITIEERHDFITKPEQQMGITLPPTFIMVKQ
jgi:hypothetical protein